MRGSVGRLTRAFHLLAGRDPKPVDVRAVVVDDVLAIVIEHVQQLCIERESRRAFHAARRFTTVSELARSELSSISG